MENGKRQRDGVAGGRERLVGSRRRWRQNRTIETST